MILYKHMYQSLTNSLYAGASSGTSGTNISTGLESATTNVDTSASTAPTSGQVLTATSGTAATWQTPSGGGGAYGEIGWGTRLYFDGTGTVANSATRPHTDLFHFRENGAAFSIVKAGGIPAGTYTNRTGTALSATQIGFFVRTA